MPRKEHHSTPTIVDRFLYSDLPAIPIDTPTFFDWLSLHSTFYFDSPSGSFTARRELRATCFFWYAFRRSHKRLYKAYLGRPADLSAARLLQIAQLLAEKVGA